MTTLPTEDYRSMASQRLLSYCSLTTQSYARPAHLRRIAGLLERVEAGEIKRLIITIPPRHGKSMLCSQFFPAWFLGKNPDKYIITATYGQDLADDFGRKVRDQMESPLFHAIFSESKLRQDTRASDRMLTTQGGSYYSVGVGGPTTGRGAHLLLIDDPIKDREQADSEVMRKKILDWYLAVAYSRLQPGGAVVVIMTRWHEEDLVGHLLKQKNENWSVVNLKAISDEGKPLWPEAYPLEVLENIKQTAIESGAEYNWHCLYQQDPIPKEGSIFKAEWLQSGHPDFTPATYMAIDPAISTKESADESAIVVVGLDYSKPSKFYELKTIHGRWDFHGLIEMVKSVYNSTNPKPQMIGVESVAYQKALGEVLRREGLPIKELKADTDKVRRANTTTHLFSQKRVFINTPELRDQLLRFRGAGEPNDLVDALVHCLHMVEVMGMEGIEKREDRYAHLVPDQRAIWKAIHAERGLGQDDDDSDTQADDYI